MAVRQTDRGRRQTEWCGVSACDICLKVALLWEGDVCDGVVVAGHDQLRCKAAEGALEEVACTGANEKLRRCTGRRRHTGKCELGG